MSSKQRHYRRARAALCAWATSSAAPAAFAHAFGERYDLPAPLPYFVAGAALAVALSFVVVAWALRARLDAGPARRLAIARGTWLATAHRVSQTTAVLLLMLVFAACAFGDPHPGENIAPTLVWIVWWVGLSLFAACVGNPWPALDPWRALFEAADAVARRLGAENGVALDRPYPRALGMWPAVFFLLLLAWIEVVFPGADKPARIALWAGAWTIVTLGGMVWFGRAVWQRHADFMACYFDLLGRFAPLAAAADGRAIELRWPASGLLPQHDRSFSLAAFAVAMLATVLFDGLLGTQVWRLFDRTFTDWAPRLIDRDDLVLGTLGIALTWGALLAAYLLACAATARLLRTRSTPEIAQLFAASLVPIAIGYHVAHNFTYFVEEGRNLLALVSDPLGRGWDLFGSADYRPELGVVGARAAWYVAIGAIVIGHVLAIWVAHRVALDVFVQRRRAVLASVPMTALMVGYTALSLTIIAEPLVRFNEPEPALSRADTGVPLRAGPVDRAAAVDAQEGVGP